MNELARLERRAVVCVVGATMGVICICFALAAHQIPLPLARNAFHGTDLLGAAFPAMVWLGLCLALLPVFRRELRSGRVALVRCCMVLAALLTLPSTLVYAFVLDLDRATNCVDPGVASLFLQQCRDQAESHASHLADTMMAAALVLALATTVVSILAVVAANRMARYQRNWKQRADPQETPVEEPPDECYARHFSPRGDLQEGSPGYSHVRHFLLRGDLPKAVRAYQAFTGAEIADARKAVDAMDRVLSPQRYR